VSQNGTAEQVNVLSYSHLFVWGLAHIYLYNFRSWSVKLHYDVYITTVCIRPPFFAGNFGEKTKKLSGGASLWFQWDYHGIMLAALVISAKLMWKEIVSGSSTRLVCVIWETNNTRGKCAAYEKQREVINGNGCNNLIYFQG